jgi:hypothetical protein
MRRWIRRSPSEVPVGDEQNYARLWADITRLQAPQDAQDAQPANRPPSMPKTA